VKRTLFPYERKSSKNLVWICNREVNFPEGQIIYPNSIETMEGRCPVFDAIKKKREKGREEEKLRMDLNIPKRQCRYPFLDDQVN